MLLRNISTTLITQILSMFLGIFTSVIINRSLLPEGRGFLASFLTSIELIGLFSTLGYPKSFIYFVAKGKDDLSIVGEAIGIALTNLVLVAIVTMPLLFALLNKQLEEFPIIVLWLAIPLVTLESLSAGCNAILRGLGRINQCNIGILITRLVYSIFIFLWAFITKLDLEFVVSILILSRICELSYYYICLKNINIKIKVSYENLKAHTIYGLKYLYYSLVARIHNKADILIIGSFLNSIQVGYYSTSVSLIQMLWNLPFAINLVLFPFISQRKNDDDSSILTAQIARVSTLILFFVGLIIMIAAPNIIYLLYGKEFLPSVEPLRILTPGIIMFSIAQVTGAHLLGRDHLKEVSIITTIVAVINIILNILIIPIWNINGVALISTLTYTLNAIAFSWYIVKENHVSMSEIFFPKWSDLIYLWKRVLSLAKLSR